MNKPSLTSRDYISVTPKTTVEVIPYPEEQVEHLVSQLIKLQKNCDTCASATAKEELFIAMRSINKALEGALINRLIIKP